MLNVRSTIARPVATSFCLGPEHPFQDSANLVHHFVNDVVTANFDAFLLSQQLGPVFGDDVKREDDGFGADAR